MKQTIIAFTLSLLSLQGAATLDLPSGTKISCRLEQTISSATAEEGQPVQLSVTEDVRIGDLIVIPQGAPVVGTITSAIPKRRMGRTGKLDFSIDKVRTADGKYIPLRYTMHKKEGASNTTKTGILTAASAVVFWPAAPAFLLMKGKDVNINRGLAFDVFTDQDFKTGPAAAVAPVVSQATGNGNVTITSDLPDAEIEVDGAFVGTAPATRALSAGNHRIVVRSGQRSWERTLSVQAGDTVNVKAVLGTVRSASR